MKSDRRTLAIAIAVVAFLILNVNFRSYMLLGARLLIGTTTMDGLAIGTTEDPNSSLNLGGWSVKPPTMAGPSRNEQLGQVLQTMSANWNQEIEAGHLAPAILEGFCTKNPTDLGARAHLLRLATNVTKLDRKFPQYRLLASMCQRLAKLAEDAMRQEPDNWYWRERSFYYHSLIEEHDRAAVMFCQKPYPKDYDDRVSDEVNAREDWYRQQYRDLPASTIFPIWANTLFPHFNSSSIIREWQKIHPNDLEMRVAQVRFGQGMLQSSSNSVSAFVGLRNVRQGLWNSQKSVVTPKPIPNKAEEAKLKPIFLASGSEKQWKSAVALSVADISPFFAYNDPDYTSIQLGQYGPILIAAGLVTIISGLTIGFLSRRIKKTLEHPLWGWVGFLGALTVFGLTLGVSRQLINGSLGSSYLLWLLIVFAFWNIATLRTREMENKPLHGALIFIAAAIGCVAPYWQSTSMIFLIAYTIQKGRLPLAPWVSALIVGAVAYHTFINLAYAYVASFIALAMVAMIAGIFLLSKKELDPDQPRLSTTSIGLGLLLIGIFLTSQYDRAVVTSISDEIKHSRSIRDRLAKL